MGPDGIIMWANRRELEMLGFSKEEYIGRHISEFHADKPVIEDILGRLSNRETLNNYEARLRCKDGSIREVLINSNVYWEGDKFIHTRCFTRDVTERRRSEEQIDILAREAEHRAKKCGDGAGDCASYEVRQIEVSKRQSRAAFKHSQMSTGCLWSRVGPEPSFAVWSRRACGLLPDAESARRLSAATVGRAKHSTDGCGGLA